MSQELIDVLDENGIKTGEILPREEIHKKGLWHRSIVVAIINDKNEILLQQRAEQKDKNAGMWDISVAGHISTGQDALSAAAREINEEISISLGYHVDIKSFRYIFSYRTQQKFSNHFIENQFYDFFIYNLDIPIEEFHSQPEEVSEVRYATIFEIKEMAKQGLFHPRTEWIDVLYRYISKF